MVGLTASELQAETLFPGDTVEYYSMAFVAGDPRGHRLSKVLRVDRKDDEFPIRVDTQEMLPLTIMLKRKQDRNGVEISSEDAKWRKLRTFRLVDGEVEGETRADRLNAGLKKSISDAMRVTKKQLAREKAEKAAAGSKAVMSNFFVKKSFADDEGDTTSSQSSSFERHSTPERKPKRKPVTPRDDADRYSSSKRSPDQVKLKKSYREKKSPLKSPIKDKARRLPKYESSQHTSFKRKRSDPTPTRPKQTEPAPRKSQKSQKSISTYFPGEQRRPKKTNSMLAKFIERIEDIAVKKKDAGLNEYIALHEEEQDIEARIKSGNSDSRAADHAGKSKWSQQRKNFSKTNAKQNSALTSWLTPLGNTRKDELEEISGGGTPRKPPGKRESGRYLKLAHPDKPKSPKMNRKNIDFTMSDTSHRTKETKSKHREDHTSRREHPPLKKRGSLGTVSARAPKKSLAGQWLTRKNHD